MSRDFKSDDSQELMRGGHRITAEHVAKRILKERGFHVPKSVTLPASRLTGGLEPLAKAVSTLTFPVVLKMVTPLLKHKSNSGAVIVGIGGVEELQREFISMRARLSRSNLSPKRMLIEEVAPDGIEIVIGGISDPTFGRVLMVGIGGVLVEVYNDVAFRACPVESADVFDMLEELRGNKLLDGFRGGIAVDRQAVVDVIERLGGADGLFLDPSLELVEFELNPVRFFGDEHRILDAIFVKEVHADDEFRSSV